MRTLWEIGVVVGVASLLYVMLHAEMWVSDDPPWLRPIRIIGFIVASGMVADSLVEQWEVPMPALLTLWGGVIPISINSLSLVLKVAKKRAHVASSLDAN